MQTSNSSANAAFSATAFRAGIKTAMQLGLPGTQSERATFYWNTESSWTTADTRGKPYDWTAAPDSETTASDVVTSLTVPVAVEFLDAKAQSGDTTVGSFDSPRLKVTILDDEYTALTDQNLGLPNGMTIDGNTYLIEYWAPPQGLFEVTVYTAFAVARDES
jgi:hypothetical protein